MKKTACRGWVAIIVAVALGLGLSNGATRAGESYDSKAKELCARRMPHAQAYGSCLKAIRDGRYTRASVWACDRFDAGFVVACLWKVRDGQYQDYAVRICRRHEPVFPYIKCLEVIRDSIYSQEDLDHCGAKPVEELNACLDVLPH